MKTSIALLTITLILAGCNSAPAPTMQKNSPQASVSPAPGKAPDENATLEAIRKTVEAQATYFKLNRRYALTFDELVDARLLSSEPTAAQTGYDFKLRPAADAQTYKLSVVPSDSASTTVRHFFVDQTGGIHAEAGKDASADSPAVK